MRRVSVKRVQSKRKRERESRGERARHGGQDAPGCHHFRSQKILSDHLFVCPASASVFSRGAAVFCLFFARRSPLPVDESISPALRLFASVLSPLRRSSPCAVATARRSSSSFHARASFSACASTLASAFCELTFCSAAVRCSTSAFARARRSCFAFHARDVSLLLSQILGCALAAAWHSASVFLAVWRSASALQPLVVPSPRLFLYALIRGSGGPLPATQILASCDGM